MDYKELGEYGEHYFNKFENWGEKSPRTSTVLCLIKVLFSNLNSGSKWVYSGVGFKGIKLKILSTIFHTKYYDL